MYHQCFNLTKDVWLYSYLNWNENFIIYNNLINSIISYGGYIRGLKPKIIRRIKSSKSAASHHTFIRVLAWPNLCLSSHDATWKESSTVTSKSGLQLWPYLCYILFWTKFGAFNLDPYMLCYHGQGEVWNGGPSFQIYFLCFPVFWKEIENFSYDRLAISIKLNLILEATLYR